MTTEREEAAAFERLHTSVDGTLPKNDPERPWLTQIDVIDAIVRDFGSNCLQRFADGHESDEAQQQFMQWADSECNRMNELFLGYDPETEPASPWPYQRGVWNMPTSLGHYLRIHYVPNEEEDRFAVRDAFMAYAVEITKATTENDGKPVGDWGWMLDAASEGLRDALLGLNRAALEGSATDDFEA